jgi:hypothetical protein
MYALARRGGERGTSNVLPHLSLYVRGGVGTQLLLGCQDITGPFPSVLLDKALRIYTRHSLNNKTWELNCEVSYSSGEMLYLYPCLTTLH